MKKLDYLSEDFIEIDGHMHYSVFFDFDKCKKEKGWTDCCVYNIESGTSWNYYKINMQRGKTVIVGKDSGCQLRKIENGLFKGCYCIIEAKKSDNSFTLLYVFDKHKVLKYPKFEKLLSVKQIDELFDRTKIEKMTAGLLNQFDITKRHQDYEMFCESLPDNCWKDGQFAKNVSAKFEQAGEIKLQNEIDKKFVRLDLCKDVSRQYFKNLTAKKEQQRSL